MSQLSPTIEGVGTAVPNHTITQAEAKDFAAKIFQSGFKNLDRLLPLFDNTLIENRYLAQPQSWYGEPHKFPETNDLYETIAFDLSLKAAQQALAEAEIPPENVGAVVFVSTTGITTPSLDSKLIQALGLSPQTIRLPIWGLGCAGGVAGVARAADIARTTLEKAVLLVTVELCTLTFQVNDFSKSNLVATSLFGDGAAAVVIKMGGQGPEILGNYSHLFDNSEDIMGWDVVEMGLKVRFARSIPALVEQYMPNLIAEACQAWQISQPEIHHYVAHPGGPKVLDAYAGSLDLTAQHFNTAYEILRQHGNMSSVTVLFVLKLFLQTTKRQNQYGLMLALGPGFSAEQLLFRW